VEGSANPPSLGEFFSVIWEDWGSRVSGALSVPFTALALWSRATYDQVIWGVLAFIGILATLFQVWAKERKRVVELESELAAKAQIRGVARVYSGTQADSTGNMWNLGVSIETANNNPDFANFTSIFSPSGQVSNYFTVASIDSLTTSNPHRATPVARDGVLGLPS